MYSSIRILLLLSTIVLVSGCGNSPQRIIRVTVQYPSASPRDVADTLAYPIEVLLLGFPHVESITSISSAGSLEMYIIVARDGLPHKLFSRIARELPRKHFSFAATTPTVKLLLTTETIPTVSPADIDYIVVDLNRKMIARHGIPIRNVVSAMQKQAGGSASDMSRLATLRAIQVTAPDDRRVPLMELAEIRVENQPSHIVTRFPPAP